MLTVSLPDCNFYIRAVANYRAHPIMLLGAAVYKDYCNESAII